MMSDDSAALKRLALTFAQELAAIPQEEKTRLRNLYERQIQKKLGLLAGYDAQAVAEAGWGVMYAPGIPQAVKDALRPLVEHRTPRGRPVCVYDYPGQSAFDFRRERQQDGDLVNPQTLPYYFLLVGSPADVPFEFQQSLDLAHAVGRLYFEDAADYGRYAQAVVAYEQAETVDASPM